MKTRFEHVCLAATFALLSISACSPDSATEPAADPAGDTASEPAVDRIGNAATASSPAEFEVLFDGETLAGWRGDPDIWSVRDGAITGGSDEVIESNTFLIYEQPYSDFELRYSYRLSGPGNSGVHFRSTVADEGQFSVAGYQANVVPTNQAERFGMLYEEGGRRELALLGHKMVIDRAGDDSVVKHVVESTNPRDRLIGAVRPYPEWNDVVIIAHGNRMLHVLNGYLVFDAVDNDPAGSREGIVALQVHSGPPSYVQFRDIAVKPLTALPETAGRFVTNPGPPTPAEPGPRVRAH